MDTNTAPAALITDAITATNVRNAYRAGAGIVVKDDTHGTYLIDPFVVSVAVAGNRSRTYAQVADDLNTRAAAAFGLV